MFLISYTAIDIYYLYLTATVVDIMLYAVKCLGVANEIWVYLF